MPSATLDARPAVLRYNEAGTLATRVVFEFVDGAGDPDVSLDGEAFQWAIAPDDRRSPAIRVRLDAVAADGEVVFEVSGAEAKAQGRVKTQTQELVYRPAGASPQPWVRGRLPMREAIADGDPENDEPEEVRFRLTIGEDGPVEITSIIVRGPQGIQGTITDTWAGIWDADTAYALGAIVKHDDGKVYLALRATVAGEEPGVVAAAAAGFTGLRELPGGNRAAQPVGPEAA